MKIKILLVLLLIITSSFPQVKDTVNANSIIDKYITAIGGREKLTNVQDRITEMTGLIHELTVKMTVFQKKPDLFKQTLKVQEIEQTVLFDGKNGFIKTNEDKKEITGVELEKLKIDSNMDLILSKDTSLIKFDYAGLDTVGNKDTYKIIVSTKTGSWTQYYDTDNGFKLKDEKPIATPQGNFIQKTWYSDYKEVDGLWFPFKISQIMGKQAIEFIVLSVKLNQNIENSVFKIDK